MLKSVRRNSSGSAAVLIVLLVILGATVFGLLQRQAISDWARLRGYQPSPAIEQLAFDTTMNNSARELFYVHHPELNNREAFNHNCSGFGEETIVLGCYISTSGISLAGGIYLYDIDDARLEGVEQVTAAHEMLHAAYDRLSTKERTKVDKLVADAFLTVTDERIKQSIDNYRQRDPGVVPNELHSIIATEVRDITPELENYYKKYFTNRHAIVAFSEKYESVLTDRRNKATSLELQIAGLKSDIEELEKTLSAERDNLRDTRGSVKTQEEVASYNRRVESYNSDVRELNEYIKQHNALIEEYKSISVESQELYKALDSRPTL